MPAPPHEPNDLVRPVVVGWQLFMAAFGAWGWLAGAGYAPTGVVSAVVSIASGAILMNASVQLRRAELKERKRSVFVWAVALILFGLWSGYSAHHAFEVSQGGKVEIETLFSLETLNAGFLLVFFAASAWIDPLLMWAVEDTERAAVPVKTPAPPSGVTIMATVPKRREPRRLGMVETAGMVAVAALSPNVATAAVTQTPVAQTRNAPDADAQRDVSEDDVRRACAALQDKGVRPSYRTVAAHLGVAKSRVEKAWTPGVPLAA